MAAGFGLVRRFDKPVRFLGRFSDFHPSRQGQLGELFYVCNNEGTNRTPLTTQGGDGGYNFTTPVRIASYKTPTGRRKDSKTVPQHGPFVVERGTEPVVVGLCVETRRGNRQVESAATAPLLQSQGPLFRLGPEDRRFTYVIACRWRLAPENFTFNVFPCRSLAPAEIPAGGYAVAKRRNSNWLALFFPAATVHFALRQNTYPPPSWTAIDITRTTGLFP